MNITALKKPKTAHTPEVLIHPELPRSDWQILAKAA